jgi:hypothetical protein
MDWKQTGEFLKLDFTEVETSENGFTVEVVFR